MALRDKTVILDRNVNNVNVDKNLYVSPLISVEQDNDNDFDKYFIKYASESDIRDNRNRMLYGQPEIKLTKQDKKKLKAQKSGYLFVTLLACALVCAIGFLAYLMFSPQVQLTELSHDNSETKDRIAYLKQEIIDAQGDNNKTADMEEIKQEALALGMHEANDNQIKNISVAKKDFFVSMMNEDNNGITDETLKNAFNNLSDYYRKNSK